jgi:hypothetical protein
VGVVEVTCGGCDLTQQRVGDRGVHKANTERTAESGRDEPAQSEDGALLHVAELVIQVGVPCKRGGGERAPDGVLRRTGGVEVAARGRQREELEIVQQVD